MWHTFVGLVRLEEREIWIARVNGYESQAYELFEIGPGGALPHSVVTVTIAAS